MGPEALILAESGPHGIPAALFDLPALRACDRSRRIALGVVPIAGVRSAREHQPGRPLEADDERQIVGGLEASILAPGSDLEPLRENLETHGVPPLVHAQLGAQAAHLVIADLRRLRYSLGSSFRRFGALGARSAILKNP